MGKDQFAERCSSYPDLMILTFLPEKIICFTNCIPFFLFFIKETFSVKMFHLYLLRQSQMVYLLGSYFPSQILPTTNSKCMSPTETQIFIFGFIFVDKKGSDIYKIYQVFFLILII